MKFCVECGSPLEKKIPPGDNRERGVCTNPDCGYIYYVNPKNIVATLPYYQDKVLLCKRAIEPRYGKWTLPAGFMECAETTEEGALRETFEEAGANVEIKQLYRIYDLPYISQVYIFYLAELPEPVYAAGEESLEVELFSEDEIPWDELAFTVVAEALREFFAERKTGEFTIQNKNIAKPKAFVINQSAE